ncbi:MAG TPA: hypothetical protein VFA94_16695 [Acidimicrobiales bacterium]|nr:hypothetical protein [Acidimicrobiales bacterium]
MTDALAVDRPTRRLGTYMAVGYAVQFCAHLVGIGIRHGFRIELLHPFFFAAAMAMRAGRVWGRSVLLVVNGFLLVVGVAVGLFATSRSTAFVPLVLFAIAVSGLTIAAVDFTIPERPPLIRLPESWRPWATSSWAHLIVLISMLLAAFQPQQPFS